MKKRLISVILVATMAVSLMVGCGSDGASSSVEPNSLDESSSMIPSAEADSSVEDVGNVTTKTEYYDDDGVPYEPEFDSAGNETKRTYYNGDGSMAYEQEYE
jgi:hypothetical protein